MTAMVVVVVVVVEGRRVFTSVAGGHLCGNICGTAIQCAAAALVRSTSLLQGHCEAWPIGHIHYPTVAICNHESALAVAGANPYPPPCDEVRHAGDFAGTSDTDSHRRCYTAPPKESGHYNRAARRAEDFIREIHARNGNARKYNTRRHTYSIL